jgi:hypothetical protein
MGNAAVVESNNAPSITTLMRVFFIDFFSLVCKNYRLSVSPVLLYHTQSIGFTGNFRIWNRFSQIGNMEEGRSECYSLEHSQVSPIDLLKSHFGTVLRESFTLLPSGLREELFLILWMFSFYRIKKCLRPGAEFPGERWPE